MDIRLPQCVGFFGALVLIVHLLDATQLSAASFAVENATAGPTPKAVVQRSLRLPNTTIPLHYRVHLISNIHRKDFNYSGNVTIDVLVQEGTDEIVLNAKYLNIHEVSVRDLDSGDVFDDLTYTLEPQCHFLVIHPVQKYQAFEQGKRLRVQILFTNVMNEKTFGIYWLNYTDRHNRTVYLAATQFEPTSARLAFPCYDEPAFKANFTISLTHGSDYNAIANMDIHHRRPFTIPDATATGWPKLDNTDGLVTSTFHPSPLMSTYLVAFVISDFECIAEQHRNVTHRVFTAPGRTGRGQRALKNSVLTIMTLEDYFGINYPLNKLDHIALQKNFGAAMENWGLITYKEDNLVHAEEPSALKQLTDTTTLTHELAHQWFGNLVSPEWWTYIWLNEGFATYFGYIVAELIHPELKPMDFFVLDLTQRAFSINDMYERKMTTYVETESEIMSVFDPVTYQRAACVIKMFHHAFNQKTFVLGISNYLSKYQYSVANEVQLFDTLQEAIAEDPLLNGRKWSRAVREILLSWTHSEWIPIISVTRNYGANTITIRQRSKSTATQEHWWVPLNFASASQPDFETTHVDYFMPPQGEVTVSAEELGISLTDDDWLVANKQATGFFHVLYDDRNLMNIAKTLQANHSAIHYLNRGAIFMDLCPLIESNTIETIEVVLEMLRYLQYERDAIPWNVATDTIEFLLENLYGTASLAAFKEYIADLVLPIYRELFPPTEPHSLHLANLRNMTNSELLVRHNVIRLACKADVPECLAYTKTLALDYIHQRTNAVGQKDYYSTHDAILCMGMKSLDDEQFDELMQLLSQADSESLWYNDLIYSLQCTRDVRQLEKYVHSLMDHSSPQYIMKDRDTMMVVPFLYISNVRVRPVLLRLFRDNYRLICTAPYFIKVFNRIAEYLTTPYLEEFHELRTLIEAELKTLPADAERVALIEANSTRIGKYAKSNELFQDKYHHAIHKWLSEYHASKPFTRLNAAASVGGAHNTATRHGSVVRSARRLIRKFIF